MKRLLEIWLTFGFNSMISQFITDTWRLLVMKRDGYDMDGDDYIMNETKYIAYTNIEYNTGDGYDSKEEWFMWHKTMIGLFFGILFWQWRRIFKITVHNIFIKIPDSTLEWWSDGLFYIAEDVDPYREGSHDQDGIAVVIALWIWNTRRWECQYGRE